ncbi:type III-B CRISPR module RAMP protein Cmr1 [Candidatus Roizmanbacteria bacterium]|nr:type III-B CRISPR module RAMP protein Cmr1 [Candidatus Roizmanbacteria bacterium]
MNTITFECEIITPMFLAGADGIEPDLRPPSIKGAMRFWWRAMHGYLPIDDIKMPDDEVQKGLRSQETEIFGGGGEHARRSSVIIRTTHPELSRVKTDFPKANISVNAKGKLQSVNLLEYLAYGTYDWDKQLRKNVFQRPYYSVGEKFEIIVLFSGNSSCQKTISECLYLMSIIGGIGSRSRNGYGRLKINGINQNIESADFVSFASSLKRGHRCDYTAFSDEMKLYRIKKRTNTWNDALFELAKAYRSARTSLDKPHFGANRQYISSPLMIDNVNKSFLERHSKQYFFGIEKIDTTYIGYLLFLPYRFCQNSNLKLQNDQNVILSKYDRVNADMNSSLNGFLDSVTL